MNKNYIKPFGTRNIKTGEEDEDLTQGGDTAYSGLYGEAPRERGAFFKLAVYEREGKIAILVYERVTKSAAKWKKWWLKRIA